jgi:hypothetical protein
MERIILEAKREINFGKLTFKEIAFELGFADPAYFSRFFKVQTGMSAEQFKASLPELNPNQAVLFCARHPALYPFYGSLAMASFDCMKTKKLIVFILAVITALESLSIDLYLPAFTQIAQTFHTLIGNVQISLSLFLAGFAIGQLLWGPLSDKYGRKPVLLSGLGLFVVSAVAIHFVRYIEWLWLLRFLQAFGGCVGIVMSRAIVADMFSKEETISIFSTQSQISGIAPIIAPLLGSMLLNYWDGKAFLRRYLYWVLFV